MSAHKWKSQELTLLESLRGGKLLHHGRYKDDLNTESALEGLPILELGAVQLSIPPYIEDPGNLHGRGDTRVPCL